MTEKLKPQRKTYLKLKDEIVKYLLNNEIESEPVNVKDKENKHFFKNNVKNMKKLKNKMKLKAM